MFFMISIKHILSLFIFFLIILTSCKKNVATAEVTNKEMATGKPTPPPPPPPVHGVCDYDINETAILGAGWIKSFDETFSGNLNNWNTWHGGAFKIGRASCRERV